MKITDLLQWCDKQLQPTLFQDYAPNGLQVEGTSEITKVLAAVTASEAAIDAAIAKGAELLLVHHGYFWKSEPVPITGWKKRRIEKLLAHQINLVAYHLPLDAHPVLGNNSQLAQKMGWQITQLNTPDNLLTEGFLPEEITLSQFGETLNKQLGRTPVLLGNPQQLIKKLAWCTGGAQGYFQDAINLGVDCFVTGEVSESQFHLANETGVAFVGAGHHATERFGIQALACKMSEEMTVESSFFDEKNPV